MRVPVFARPFYRTGFWAAFTASEREAIRRNTTHETRVLRLTCRQRVSRTCLSCISAWFKVLWSRGLVYYNETHRVIGVSRFPEGIHPHLHPMVTEYRNIPWNTFVREMT